LPSTRPGSRGGANQVDDPAGAALRRRHWRQPDRGEEGVKTQSRRARAAAQADHVGRDGRPADETAEQPGPGVRRNELPVLELQGQPHPRLRVEVAAGRVVLAEHAVAEVQALGVGRGDPRREQSPQRLGGTRPQRAALKPFRPLQELVERGQQGGPVAGSGERPDAALQGDIAGRRMPRPHLKLQHPGIDERAGGRKRVRAEQPVVKAECNRVTDGQLAGIEYNEPGTCGNPQNVETGDIDRRP
jgi:hypothetical protein